MGRVLVFIIMLITPVFIEENVYSEKNNIITYINIPKNIEIKIGKIYYNGKLPEYAKINLINFIDNINKIESSGLKNAASSSSSAKGLFQFTNASFITGMNRVRNTFIEMRHEEWLNNKNITMFDLNIQQQQLLFMANIYQQRNTDKFIKEILEGNKVSEVFMYYKHHHTAPDEATRNLVRKFYGKEIEYKGFLLFKK